MASNPNSAASNQATKPVSTVNISMALIVIPALFIISILIYMFVFGHGSHFEGGNNEGKPLPGDYFGQIYKGGFIVPILLTMFLVVITFVIERFFTITKAKGKGSTVNFVRKVKLSLAANNIDGAIRDCDAQKGSVANIVRAGLSRYKAVLSSTDMDKDEKLAAIQKEIEEASSLELPMLERNLVILATIASVATLFGLLGTVLGMIRSFAALANEGGSAAESLATGISEALINTALGIGTSALAIVMYNVFTTQIDKLTYGIDEVGYSIIASFKSSH
jgi:biopolymer transport protein ExbB